MVATQMKPSGVIEAAALTEEHLQDLFANRVLALRIPNYCNPSVTDRLSTWLTTQQDLPAYTHETYDAGVLRQQFYGVFRYGVPFNKTYGTQSNSPIREEYYRSALPSIRTVRQACLPELSPIDQFRLELDETWSAGAQIASYEGRKMFLGIGRITPAADSHILEERPHVDCLPPSIYPLDGQFSANIYLQMPEMGGALEVWNVPPLSPMEIETLPEDKDWRSELPDPVVIRPQVGELILINTHRLHAVQGFDEGVRVSMQCFIGYRHQRPLFLWC